MITAGRSGKSVHGRRARRGSAWAASALAVTLLAACGSDGVEPPAETDKDTGEGEVLQLTAANYPLQYVLTKVVGPAFVVTTLTPPDANPHTVNPAQTEIDKLENADLVVTLSGFQPGVDAALKDVDNVFDVAPAATLKDRGGRKDPHFWLDISRLGAVADAVAAKMGEVDADNAIQYKANASSLKGELQSLDADIRMGLVQCESKTLVTEHQAFGYFAERYGLTEKPLAGVTGAQPSAAHLNTVTEFIQDNDIKFVYTNVTPAKWAATVAEDAGATTAALDPVETAHAGSAGEDFVAIMRTNLKTLQTGLSCEDPLSPTATATSSEGEGNG